MNRTTTCFFLYFACFALACGGAVDEGAQMGERSLDSGSCGDGILQPGERCDEGIHNSNGTIDGCRLDCTYLSCTGATYASLDASGIAFCAKDVVFEGDIRLEKEGDSALYINYTRITGSLVLAGNTDSGINLPNLRKIDGNLWVWDSPTLVNFTFPTIETVGGSVLIRNNDQLRGLSLSSLKSIGGSLAIVYNSLLPTCTAQAISEGVGVVDGDIQIFGNKPDDCGSSSL